MLTASHVILMLMVVASVNFTLAGISVNVFVEIEPDSKLSETPIIELIL